MSHLFAFKTSFSAQFQAIMELILNSSDARPHLTSLFYRVGDTKPTDAGIRHGGIDFNYESATKNDFGVSNVTSPISGTLVRRNDADGSVFIRDSNTGVVHAIFHLHSFSQDLQNLAVGSGIVTPNMVLGTMGGRGQYQVKTFETKVLGVVVGTYQAWANYQGIEVPGYPEPSFGYDAYPPHVHYEVLLPSFNASDGATWNRIDPIIYWTPGVNPAAGLDPQTSRTNNTGLLVSSLAAADLDGNANADTQGILKEGEWTTMHVGINTPHTGPLTLRVVFSGTRPDSLLFEADASRPVAARAVVTAGPAGTNIVYVTLPATVNQSTPNTQGSFRVYVLEDTLENSDYQHEAITYTVEAGYRNGDTWVSYNTNANNLFTPVENRTLYILDNDTPIAPADITVWPVLDNGTPTHREGTVYNDRFDSPDPVDLNGDGSNDISGIQGTTGAERIHGYAGHDDIFGDGGADFLYGDEGESAGRARIWTGRTTEGSRAPVSACGPRLDPIGDDRWGGTVETGECHRPFPLAASPIGPRRGPLCRGAQVVA